ncbi:MAG: T9SS type A sorting domain-containing protein [Candidatus Azobacteroides sp.]|nr:T9SS type A sorting domain-containing protein [Candidatus Azobacteroides sp.]
MINISSEGDQVWVAAGLYFPSHSAQGWTDASPTPVNTNLRDKHNAFILKSGVKVYGGFAGNETELSQRNWIENRVILSGDYDQNDPQDNPTTSNSSENTYHVVISANNTKGTELDGFTISGGNHHREQFPDAYAVNVNGVNIYTHRGGGLYARASAATVRNLEIRGNAAFEGGGMYCITSSELRGENLIFYKNIADQGGGMYVNHSPKFKNIIFMENWSKVGGGVSVAGEVESSGTQPHFINALFHRNFVVWYGYGAGMQVERASPVLTNATIIGNYGGSYGAGILNYYNAFPVLNNTIVWNNRAENTNISNVVDYTEACRATYNYSLLQGADLSATGGLDATVAGFDPMFISPPSDDRNGAAGSFTLQLESPCIDMGNPDLYLEACGSDFQGWENEYALTPPPYIQWHGGDGEYFGGWYPEDQYSGKKALRIAGKGINIGAFEEIIFEETAAPKLESHLTMNVKNYSYEVNAGDNIQLYIIVADMEEVPIGLFTQQGNFLTNIVVSQNGNVYNCTISAGLSGEYVIAPYYEESGSIKIIERPAGSHYIDKLPLKVNIPFGSFGATASASPDIYMTDHLQLRTSGGNYSFTVDTNEQFQVNVRRNELENTTIGLFNTAGFPVQVPVTVTAQNEYAFACKISDVLSGEYILVPVDNNGNIIERTPGAFVVDRLPLHVEDAWGWGWFSTKNALSVTDIQEVIAGTEDVLQIEVYTVLGRKVTSIPEGQRLDVESLMPDTYLIKVITGKDTFSYKVKKN